MTVIADHSVALLEVIQAIVDDIDRSAAPQAAEAAGADHAAEHPAQRTNGKANAKTGYQAIPITLQE
jgi:hypothetical protein